MNRTKNNIVSAFFISIIILISHPSMAVENYINFISLEGEQKFSQDTVGSILQDSKGYMWFGSNDGLIKYDGYNMSKYRQTPFGEKTLLDNYIIDLEEDDDGNIWIGTSKGLTRLDPKKEEFSHYRKSQYKINSKRISAILKSKNGDLWVGTSDNGLSKYNKDTDEFIPYMGKLSSKNITTLSEDKQGHLWIGTEYGANRLNLGTREVKTYNYDKANDETISSNYITAIRDDQYGDVWIGTKTSGLNKINGETGKIVRYLKDAEDSYSLGSNYITSIIEDQNDTLWIASKQGGLARYDREKDHFVKRISDAQNIYSNKQNNILTLSQDHTGLMWVGTEYGGISKFNPLSSFQNYTSVEAFDNSMNDNNILSIYKDRQGIIWAGTKNGGVNRLDLDNRTVDYYKHDISDGKTLASNTVNHIIEDSKGLMWFATDRGLSILDEKTGEISNYSDGQSDQTITNNNINYILEDSYKEIWLGTEGGLEKYDRDKSELTKYTKGNSKLSGNHITTLFEDKDKNLWIGTFHDGLNKYDRQTKEIKSYRNNPQDEKTISNDQIKSIVEDDVGNLWIGTANGLNKLNMENEEFTVFTEKNQLKTNFISDILKFGNFLWISSNDGVSKFDIKNEKIVKSYSVIDGLQGSYFNSGSAYRSEDGQLLFGGTEGFNTIYPDMENKVEYVPEIILSSFKVNDELIDIENKKNISLSHFENKIYFEFGVIDYKKPNNNNHFFKLEGYDKTWRSVKGRNYGIYDNLQPGDYTLKIKGFNSEGVSTQDNIEFDILIKPPFWKTKLAYVIYILLAGSLVFFFFNYVKFLERIINDRTEELNKTNNRLVDEISQKEKLFEEKMEIENYRNDFFINLSHELRTPLNIITSTIQLSEMYIKNENAENAVEKVKGHFDIMRKNCYRLLKTVNNIMDVSKLETKQYELNKSLINIVYLVEDVVSSTIIYAEGENIEIIFNTETEEEIVKCDPVEIERVILNIISNAIKYSKENGHTWVNVLRRGKNVEISIKDDGIGIPKEKQEDVFVKFKRVDENTKLGSGVGLSLSKLLIEMHDGRLEFNSREGVGSEFIISLPVYDMKEDEYKDILDLEEIDIGSMDLEIEMSEIK